MNKSSPAEFLSENPTQSSSADLNRLILMMKLIFCCKRNTVESKKHSKHVDEASKLMRVFSRNRVSLKRPGCWLGVDWRKTETEEKDTNLTLILPASVTDALIR